MGRILAALFACALLVEGVAAAEPYWVVGEVVRIHDGDTLTLRDDRYRSLTVRLTDIDAPEAPKGGGEGMPSQPFAKASRKNLVKMAARRHVRALCYELDRYRRHVCRVRVGEVDLSLEQIKAGLAWANGANRKYVRDERAFALEQDARAARRGLWRDPAPVEPWRWRKACWQEKQCANS